MKKSLLSVFCLIVVIFPNLVFSEIPGDKLVPRATSARIWDKFDIAFKTILIGGLLVGYRSGIATGASSEHRRLNNNNVISRVEAAKLTAQGQSLFKKPISFYVDQTDLFLQTYPACKEMLITGLLDQLVHVWASSPLKADMGYDFIKIFNYKDVEKVCLEGLPK